MPAAWPSPSRCPTRAPSSAAAVESAAAFPRGRACPSSGS
jgi:hypothetical protein